MPIALLHRIAREVLPHILTDHWEAAAFLVHAGHVEARTQLVPCPWGGLPRLAMVVSKITPSGRAICDCAAGQSPTQFALRSDMERPSSD